jgi:hypothetical protein
MNRLLTSVSLAIVAILATTLPSASGFALLSPLLLRVNPSGIAAARMNKSSPVTDSASIISPSKASDNSTTGSRPPLASVDFGYDEDLLRYKHELLSAVYEKSLTRGFE